jgi:hypothetical protein
MSRSSLAILIISAQMDLNSDLRPRDTSENKPADVQIAADSALSGNFASVFGVPVLLLLVTILIAVLSLSEFVRISQSTPLDEFNRTRHYQLTGSSPGWFPYRINSRCQFLSKTRPFRGFSR